MNSIGYHEQPIIDKQNNCQRKPNIDHPLKIGIDIISQPIQGVGYFILTSIRTLFICGTIKCSLLYFIIIICIRNNSIQNLDRICTIFSSTIILSKRKHTAKTSQQQSKNYYYFFTHTIRYKIK